MLPISTRSLRAERVGAVRRRLLDHFVNGFAQTLAVARPPDQPQEVPQTGKGPIVLRLADDFRRWRVAHAQTDPDMGGCVAS